MTILEWPVLQLHQQRRKHSRYGVNIIAYIRVSGGLHNKVQLTDLSRTGFQMECLSFIPPVGQYL